MKVQRVSLNSVVIIAVATGALALSAAGPAGAAPAAGRARTASAAAICTSTKRQHFAAWLSAGITKALAGRKDSVIGLTVSDAHLDLSCALNQKAHFDAASAIKATIISALLLKVGGPSHMSASQKNLAWLMITESDNDAATDLWDEVGIGGMQDFLNKAGMTHTELNYAWGLTQLTAQDELTLLHVLTTANKVLSAASRSYVLYLMANVIPGQRWGVPAGAPSSVKVSLKNGWLPQPGPGAWHVNSIGAFFPKTAGYGYQIVVLTSDNPTEQYGINTIEDAARVINRDISLAKG
jgi:Beta-lactamase enzyme family